jgi:hypothetical protein
MYKDIAARVASVRAGRTYREFGKHLGVHHAVCHRWELGVGPSVLGLRALARRGVDLNWLITGSPNPRTKKSA